MKHYLHLLLAATLSAISIGAAAAVHDWTATRIGTSPSFTVIDMNNAGQVTGLFVSGSSQRAFLYTPGSSGGLVDLGSLGDRRSIPTALNASGQVVGGAWGADGEQRAFIYQNGSMQRLMLPGGDIPGTAMDINDHGQVLVRSVASVTSIINPTGPPTVLNSPENTSATGFGINNRGQVYGQSSSGVFFYDNGRFTENIVTLGGTYPYAGDMNESGQVVGVADTTGERPRPFLYSDGRTTEIPGTNYGIANYINDRGQVVGTTRPTVNSPAGTEVFFYSDGQIHEVGGLGDDYGAPSDLNELGQVVGFFRDPTGNLHSFFYSDDDGRTTDLTRWLRSSFNDVAFADSGELMQLNDLGQIALAATLTNGQKAFFVLTPIPEPSTYALMFAGLGVLPWIARRQRGRSIGNRVD